MRIAFVVLLVVALNALSPEEQFFDQIAKNDFGKTIIQTIQLTLSEQQGQATLDKLFVLLRKMKDDIENENTSEFQILSTRQAQCQNKIQDADADIKVAALKKSGYERAYPLIREERLDKQRQVIDKQQEEQRNLDSILQLEQERVQQKADFQAAREELSEMVGALEEAKHLISQVSQAGYVQLTDSILTQLKDQQSSFYKFKETRKPSKRSFHSLINIVFATIQDKSFLRDHQAVEKVVAVINQLIESVYEVQKQEMIADDQREQDFQTQRARLVQTNQRLSTKTADAKAKAFSMDQKLLELENNIASCKQTIDSKNEEKSDWRSACSDAEASFNRMGGIRKEEIDIIVKCIDVLQRRVEGVTSFIEKIHIH